MPWAYVRRAIARSWHCKPFEVDEAPAGEIRQELRIMGIEAEVLEERKKGKGRG